MKKNRGVGFLAILLIAGAIANNLEAFTYDVYMYNNANSVVKYPLKMVPVKTSLHSNSPLDIGVSQEVQNSMFNGAISVGQRTNVFSLDPTSLPYWAGSAYRIQPFYFEWQMYLQVGSVDIPVGRIMIGCNSSGDALAVGVISQTTIDSGNQQKISLFDNFESYQINASNRTKIVYEGRNYFFMEDDGSLILPSGDGYLYKISFSLSEDGANIQKQNADRRIWISFSIVGQLPAGSPCTDPSGMKGTYDPNGQSGKKCRIEGCAYGYNETKNFYFDQGWIDSSDRVCKPKPTARCWKYAVSGQINDSLDDCIIPDNQVCKVFAHNGPTTFTGVSYNQKCQEPEGSACIENKNPGVFSYQGTVQDGVCTVSGTRCTADYLRNKGMIINTTIGRNGCLAKPGDPCKVIATGEIGRYEGDSAGINARCVVP